MKRTFVTLEALKDITKRHSTPFHLYDEKGIRENVRNLQKAFSWNKNFKEYFAVKATPNPSILQILREEGCGVDCSSYTELIMADAVGFKEQEIMFSSNATPMEDMELAHKLKAIINLDDITDIDLLKDTVGIPETICLRYNPGKLFTVNNRIMGSSEDAKYGFTADQLIEGVKRLKNEGVKNFGLHAFLVSNTLDNDYYPKLARLLFQTAVQLNKETGANFSFINLSGGIGIPYRPEEQAADIFKIGEGVRKAYEEIFTPANMDDVAIYAELGRFITGPYGCLVAKAIHEKKIYRNYVGLDACAANLMRPAMYGAYHHITVMGKEKEPHIHKYDITGGLCENNDKFAINRMLPQVEIGDLIVIHDTGAHGFAMGYNYNGKLRSAELLLKPDGAVKLIRRAETPADYFATFSDIDGFRKKVIGKYPGIFGKYSIL